MLHSMKYNLITSFLIFISLLFLINDLSAQRYPDFIPYRKGNKWGFCDSIKNIKIPVIYDKVDLFVDGISKVEIDKGVGFIDTSWKAKWLFYCYHFKFISDTIIIIEANNKWGAMNNELNIIIPLKYDSINSFIEGRAIAILNNNPCLIDKSGHEIIDSSLLKTYMRIFEKNSTKNKKIILENQDLTIINNKKKYGVIDSSKNIIIPIIYDNIIRSTDGLFRVNKGYLWTYFDRKGNQLISFQYTKAGDFNDGLALVEKNYKSFYINKKGKEYFEK